MRFGSCRWSVLLLAGLLLAAGCSSNWSTGTVSGTVNVDGKPAERGSIAFIPQDGKGQTAGGEIKGGKYTAHNVPVGVAKVEIRVSKSAGKRKLYDTPDSPWQEELHEVLPAKFNDSTELRLDVKSGSNEKNWDLKSK